MSYAALLHHAPEELRKAYRQYENSAKKLINLKWSIEFNSICLRENILPNYTKLRHYDPAIASTNATRKYRRYLVEREIDNNLKSVKVLEKRINECLEGIESFPCNPGIISPIREELDCILKKFKYCN